MSSWSVHSHKQLQLPPCPPSPKRIRPKNLREMLTPKFSPETCGGREAVYYQQEAKKRVSLYCEKEIRKDLKAQRETLKKAMLKLQSNDLWSFDEVTASIMSSTDNEMALNFVKNQSDLNRKWICDQHELIKRLFKIMPNLECQKNYSDQLATYNYGYSVYSFIINNKIHSVD